MLHLTEEDNKSQYPDEYPKEQIAEADKQKEGRHSDENNQFGAVGKGKGKGGERGKGYGKCWHCGEWGHPRRECLEWLKL